MSVPDHFAERAPGIAALPATDPERVAAEEHARSCLACAEALREARALVTLLDSLPPAPPPSEEVAARVMRAVAADRAAERAVGHATTVATLLAWCVFAALAKQRAHDPTTRIESIALAAVAIGCVVGARRGAARMAMVGAVAASALLVLFAAADAGLSVRIGIKCTLIELVAASLPYGAAVYLAIRTRSEATSIRFAATAAAGALAGQAALVLTCPVRTQGPHLLFFHLGGVVLAALLGAAGAKLLPERGFGSA